MKQLKILFVLLLLVPFSSCVKDITLDKEFLETKMVVNCLLDNNTPITVFVTESVPVDGTLSIKCITDAVVELYINDSFSTVLPFVVTDTSVSFGSYLWTQFPVSGNKYSFKVKHPKYVEATGEDFFPDMPQISNLQITQQGDSTNAYITKFKLNWQDDGSKENYYRLNVWNEGRRITSIQASDTITEHYEKAARPEILTELSDTARDYDISLLFSDKNFNGQNKEINFQFKTIDLRNMMSDTLQIVVGNISKAHYDYFKTMNVYRAGNPGYESVQVLNNITNGYGIIMSQHVTHELFIMK